MSSKALWLSTEDGYPGSSHVYVLAPPSPANRELSIEHYCLEVGWAIAAVILSLIVSTFLLSTGQGRHSRTSSSNHAVPGQLRSSSSNHQGGVVRQPSQLRLSITNADVVSLSTAVAVSSSGKPDGRLAGES